MKINKEGALKEGEQNEWMKLKNKRNTLFSFLEGIIYGCVCSLYCIPPPLLFKIILSMGLLLLSIS